MTVACFFNISLYVMVESTSVTMCNKTMEVKTGGLNNTAMETGHAQFLYLLSLIIYAVVSMCSHCGQQAEEALQRIAVTGRKQKYQELQGALLF